jgi:proteasome accessory factor B
MSARKSERLLNLLIALLVSRTFLTKAEIRSVIEPYRDAGDEAFEKMFERDKEELRQLGIPIEIGSHDAFFEDELGYRVRRDAYELPDITLAPDEAAMVGLAARVWQHAGLAEATADALLKLKAAGIDADDSALDIARPEIGATEPAFEDVWAATVERHAISFEYRTGTGAIQKRRVEPWGMSRARGRWYVVGHDLDRGEERVFRLSRIQGAVTRIPRGAAYDVPPDFDLRQAMASVDPRDPSATAALRVRPGRAVGLRRRVTGVDADATWEHAEVDYAREGQLVDELVSYGDAVVVDGPESLRDAVLARLQELAR